MFLKNMCFKKCFDFRKSEILLIILKIYPFVIEIICWFDNEVHGKLSPMLETKNLWISNWSFVKLDDDNENLKSYDLDISVATKLYRIIEVWPLKILVYGL